MANQRNRRGAIWLRRSIVLGFTILTACVPSMEAERSTAALSEAPPTARRLVVTRITQEDGTFEESVDGDGREVDLLVDDALASSIETGSTDGRTTTTRYAIETPERRSLEGDGRRTSAPPRPLSEDDVVARVLDAELLEVWSRGGDAYVDVLVGMTPTPQEPIVDVMTRVRAGRALSPEEEGELRAREVENRFAEMRAIQDPVFRAVASTLGGVVTETFVVANAATLHVPARNLRALALRDNVEHVDPIRAMRQGSIDGWKAVLASQVDQYIATENTGGRPNPTRHSHGNIALGVLDYSFEDDWEALGDSRVAARWDCWTDPCVPVSEMDAPLEPPFFPFFNDTRHGTACAQIATGRAPAPDSYRNPRSGASREASLVLAIANNNASMMRAMDRFALSVVDIVSSSYMSTASGCSTSTLVSTALNNHARIYGTAWFQNAGNLGHSGSSCTLQDPAGATYAFAVGGLLEEADVMAAGTGYTAIQTGQISSFSSRGNMPYLDGTRSVIGTTAVAGQVFMPEDLPNTYAYIGMGTSFAAPLVAGAAVDLRDWWLQNGPALGYGTGFMNTPGFTYSQLLLMGDRRIEGATEVKTKVGFDSLFGNGRFRARIFSSAGMDDPWNVKVSAFYVSAFSETTFHVWGGQALPNGVDRLVVALWWAEPDYAAGADITIKVRTTCGTSFTRADESYDNKKRVFINAADVSVGGNCWAVDVKAWSTPPNAWDGGQARRYVYLAYYYEDELRDDLWSGIQ